MGSHPWSGLVLDCLEVHLPGSLSHDPVWMFAPSSPAGENAPAKVSITPSMARATLRRFSKPRTLPTGFAACGGIRGKLIHCQIIATTVRGARAQKTPLQPIIPPK